MLHLILIWFITGFGNQPAGWIPSMRPSMGRVSRATRTWNLALVNVKHTNARPFTPTKARACCGGQYRDHFKWNNSDPLRIIEKKWNKSLSTGFLEGSALFLSLHYFILHISICNFYKKKNSHLFLYCEYMHIHLILFSIGYWHNSSNGIAIKKIILT